MKFVKGPECYPEAGQESPKNGEPCKYKTLIAGMFAYIIIVSRTRDAESMKAEETAPTRAAAVDSATDHKGQVFPDAACPGPDHPRLATRARAARGRVPHRALYYRATLSFGYSDGNGIAFPEYICYEVGLASFFDA